MPINWKTYKLSEVTSKIGSGATPRGGQEAYKSSGISLIRSQNVLDFTFSTNGLAFIDDEQASKLNNVIIEENDVLLNITGDSVARVCKVPSKYLPARVNQHVAIVRADSSILNSEFLKYSLLEKTNKDKLLTLASAGATRNAITKSMIENFEIVLPELQEQKSIASILSTIDDKIENNLAINKTLEEMAMALYKHWFVDFGPFQDCEFVESELGKIPKGWEIKIFSELYEVKKGLSYKSKFYSDKGIPMINLKCVDRNGGFRYDGVKYYDGDYKRQHVVLPGDLLVAMTDLTQDRTVLGSPLIAPDLNTSSDVIASLDISILKQIQSETSHLNLFFYYQMRTHKYHEYILGYGNGSTVMHLDKKGLLDYTCFLPSNDVLEKFNELVSNLRNRIELNIKENQTLTQLRDTLLPKLISGEVRLKEYRT